MGKTVVATAAVITLFATALVGFVVLGAGAVTPPGCGPIGVGPAAGAGPGDNTTGGGVGAVQLANASAVISAGKGMGVGEQGIIVALAVGLQESSLRNLANDGTDPRLEPEQRDVARSLTLAHDGVGHDHGSVGLMQQQYPWWGTLEELMNPSVAAQKFFAKLLVVPGYATLPVTVAAQTVQRSGLPTAYADDEVRARALYAQLQAGAAPVAPTVMVGDPTGGGAAPAPCASTPGSGGIGPVGVVTNGVTVELPAQAGVGGTLTFPNQAAATAAATALSYLGVGYAWGGGGLNGPTLGIRDGGVADSFGDYAKVGFDCSGLVQAAYGRAGIDVGHPTAQQWEGGTAGPHLAYAQALPGDLIFYGTPTHHVSLYLGQISGRQLMVEAPHSGDVVKVSTVYIGDMVGVTRPTAAGARP